MEPTRLNTLLKRRISALVAGLLVVFFALWCVSLLVSVNGLRDDLTVRVGWLRAVQDIRSSLDQALEEGGDGQTVDLNARGRDGLALLSQIDRERFAQGLSPLGSSEPLTISFSQLTSTVGSSPQTQTTILSTLSHLNTLTQELRSDTASISRDLSGRWDSLTLLVVASLALAMLSFWLLISIQRKAQRLAEASHSLEEKIAEQIEIEQTLRESRALYKDLSADLDLKAQLHTKALSSLALDAEREKWATVKALAEQVAHELNNTVTIITLSSQFIESSLEAQSPLQEDIEHLNEASSRIGAVARRLHLLAEKNTDAEPERTPVDVELPWSSVEHSAQPGEVVLVVEDEDVIRRFVVNTLEEAGWRVLTANSFSNALLRASSHRDTIDLLLSDLVLPHQSSLELAASLKKARPGMGVLFMSSSSATALSQHDHDLSKHELLPKPFTAEVLVASVRRALDEARDRAPQDDAL